MKKQLLSLGKALSNAEQKEINGGNFGVFFDTCSGITSRHECLSNPTCGWDGTSCYSKVPHIV